MQQTIDWPVPLQRLALEPVGSLVRETTAPDVPMRKPICSPPVMAAYLWPYFRRSAVERFVVVMLNTANVATSVSEVSVGGLACSIVEPRGVFQTAMLANAASVVLAHNHPSGNPEPSKEDVAITKRLCEAGRLLGIPVHDHLIITTAPSAASDGYTSLAERGLL